MFDEAWGIDEGFIMIKRWLRCACGTHRAMWPLTLRAGAQLKEIKNGCLAMLDGNFQQQLLTETDSPAFLANLKIQF